jgi:Fungal Zn(2)-Cys(6) binuclear cluster domain
MVYRGLPSRGCKNCRKLHVKCDEGRPSCSRCSRTEKSCTGYRDVALLVCDETETVRSRALGRAVRPGTKLDDLSIEQLPQYCARDVIVWQFYCQTKSSLPKSGHAYYLHSELPYMYSRSLSTSALHLSTQAIAYAVAAKSHKSAARFAREYYAKAISAMKLTLQDTQEVMADETLYAVLLLSGYETITCTSEKLIGWAAHVSGAATLLIHRGKESFERPFASRMFHFARRSIVLYHIQTCTPTARIFKSLDEPASLDENEEDRLFSIMARLPQIQHRERESLDRPTTPKNGCEIALLHLAKLVDGQLVAWQNNLPPAWSITIAQSIHVPDAPNIHALFFPKEIHKYRDFRTARVSNLCRVSRIILQSIIVRLHNRMQLTDDMDCARTSIQKLVDEICSSVSYLSGDELSKMRLPEPQTLSVRNAGERSPVTTEEKHSSRSGRYCLFWPLYVASSVTCVPSSQRKWMRQQLLSFGEAGEPLATWLAASESQLVAGRAENFAFDCV